MKRGPLEDAGSLVDAMVRELDVALQAVPDSWQAMSA